MFAHRGIGPGRFYPSADCAKLFDDSDFATDMEPVLESAAPVVQSNFAGGSTVSVGVHAQRLLKVAEHKEDDNIVQGEKRKSKAALASARTAALEEDSRTK